MEHLVDIRDLEQSPEETIRSATAYDSLVIADDGKPRWRVIPYLPEGDTLQDRVERGEITPATKFFLAPEPSEPESDLSNEDLLSEMRDDK